MEIIVTDEMVEAASAPPNPLAYELACIAAEAGACTFFLKPGTLDLDYALRTLDYAATHLKIAQRMIEKMGGKRDGI